MAAYLCKVAGYAGERDDLPASCLAVHQPLLTNFLLVPPQRRSHDLLRARGTDYWPHGALLGLSTQRRRRPERNTEMLLFRRGVA